jgi:hypothetical protein
MSADAPVVPLRSTFVTVTAWIFIVLSAFATVTSVMQNVMVGLMFPTDEIVAAVNRDPKAPPGMAIVFGHLKLIMLLFLGMCVATLASSIGLLRRREWARKVFIAVLLLGILWMIGGFVLQYFFMSSVNAMPTAGGAAVDAQFGMMMKVVMVFGALTSLTFAAIFGWIIYKLMSPAIRGEFLAA